MSGAHLQVPDIYDSAKYDSIHNRHLGLDFRDLYQVRRPVNPTTDAVVGHLLRHATLHYPSTAPAPLLAPGVAELSCSCL